VGWLSNCLPTRARVWLTNEAARPPDLTAVWLKKGASARSSEIRSARRGPRRITIGKDNG
jgi:hypothetical protein